MRGRVLPKDACGLVTFAEALLGVMAKKREDLGINITTAPATRIPRFKLIGPLLLATLVFPTAACAAHYMIDPGALNFADPAACDTLLVAEAAIEQARVENQTRTSHSAEKARGAIETNVPSDPYIEQLTKTLRDLTMRFVRSKAEMRRRDTSLILQLMITSIALSQSQMDNDDRVRSRESSP
jgi:hypothetical protein